MKKDMQLCFEQFQKWVCKTYTHHDMFFLGMGYGNDTITFHVAARKDSRKERSSYAVKYYPEKHVLVAWDMVRRREAKGTENYTLNRNWEEIGPNPYTAFADYCSFKGVDGFYWDKVVVVGEFFFQSFLNEPEKWLAFNADDTCCPQELRSIRKQHWISDRERKKYSVSQRERDARFHLAVLDAYDYRCAVCGINIVQVLQAAHLRNHEVAQTKISADIPENGVCLCANHHLMYDRNLIDIDVKNNTLHILDERLKQIPWYRELEANGSKLAGRTEEK